MCSSDLDFQTSITLPMNRRGGRQRIGFGIRRHGSIDRHSRTDLAWKITWEKGSNGEDQLEPPGRCARIAAF